MTNTPELEFWAIGKFLFDKHTRIVISPSITLNNVVNVFKCLLKGR